MCTAIGTVRTTLVVACIHWRGTHTGNHMFSAPLLVMSGSAGWRYFSRAKHMKCVGRSNSSPPNAKECLESNVRALTISVDTPVENRVGTEQTTPAAVFFPLACVRRDTIRAVSVAHRPCPRPFTVFQGEEIENKTFQSIQAIAAQKFGALGYVSHDTG